ncbi:MAG: hypothetical protein IJT45_00040 [Bacteroidales bacterium]|nr:hypothetical protein [Bacteroidales bacterium]
MSGFAGDKNIRENDDTTKEIHEQIQGHGCLGCNNKKLLIRTHKAA